MKKQKLTQLYHHQIHHHQKEYQINTFTSKSGYQIKEKNRLSINCIREDKLKKKENNNLLKSVNQE